jgi:hypothetical protein
MYDKNWAVLRLSEGAISAGGKRDTADGILLFVSKNTAKLQNRWSTLKKVTGSRDTAFVTSIGG